ncbi:MAG TPA: hypothetical protein VK828_04580 [Terriglobales bacterium]|jgi:hypothetical protein|nr:hypothetical protein [Terriglobales bacterium]
MHSRLIVLAAAVFLFSGASNSQSKPVATAKPSTVSKGDAQTYRNSTYGFRYQVPFGWVERSKQMQEGNGDSKGEVLLAVFERPPEATGDSINSAIVIASESAAFYPGLKKAEDYLGPLTELATSNGFHTEGDPSVVTVDGRELVRADFTKQIGAKKSDSEASNGQLTMRQATLVLLARRQIVSFTFIAGSEDELDKLVDNLHFGVAKPAAH